MQKWQDELVHTINRISADQWREKGGSEFEATIGYVTVSLCTAFEPALARVQVERFPRPLDFTFNDKRFAPLLKELTAKAEAASTNRLATDQRDAFNILSRELDTAKNRKPTAP